MNKSHLKQNQKANIPILKLPKPVLRRILEFLSFEQISRIRIVSKVFDQICRTILNEGFLSTKLVISGLYNKLPVGDSDIWNEKQYLIYLLKVSLDTLNSTFDVNIKRNVSCFVLGKVLDNFRWALIEIRENRLINLERKIKTDFQRMIDRAGVNFTNILRAALTCKDP